MIVDAHAHLGPIPGFRIPQAGVPELLALMDALAIDATVVMHAGGIFEVFDVAYEASEEAWRDSGGRLPYALTYHPRYAEESLRWIRRALERPGCVGIKIHPGQHQVFPDTPAYEPVWQLAAERQVPIIAHSWALSDYNPTQRYAVPERFGACVSRFPSVNLVLGHAGGRYEGHLAAASLARRYPNVYLDLSGDSYSFGLVEWLVANAGAERLLFGTDSNWMDQRTHLGRVLDADISLEDKRLILGANACRLFKLSC